MLGEHGRKSLQQSNAVLPGREEANRSIFDSLRLALTYEVRARTVSNMQRE